MIRQGEKYYKWLDDNVVKIVRVKKIKDNSIMFTNGEVVNNLDDYTLLKPFGYTKFNIVQLGDTEDILITHVRNLEYKDAGVIWSACRQFIVDIFYEKVKPDQEHYKLGMSLNRDNCPADVDFNMMMLLDKEIYSEEIAYYIDDTLDNIIGLLQRPGRFNKILERLYQKDSAKLIGLNKDLKSLIIDIEFMNDIRTGYSVLDLTNEKDFSVDIENDELNPISRIVLENKINVEMFRTFVLKYDLDINLDEFQRSYQLVWYNDQLFIIGYDKGDYINRAAREQLKHMQANQFFFKSFYNNKYFSDLVNNK